MITTTDSLRTRALRLLARREYSRQELAARLLSNPVPHPKAQRRFADDFTALSTTAKADMDEVYEIPSVDTVNALLDDLEQRKMLSDNRYAEIRTRLRAPRYGDTRLRQELAQKGVDRDTIATVLSEQPDELSRCQALWQKKFGQLPCNQNERMKQIRYLVNRGFSMRTIQQVTRGEGSDGPLNTPENLTSSI